MPDSLGTSINAKGNHFPSKPVNILFNHSTMIKILTVLPQITDDIKIKLLITLGVPSNAPENLKILFENQIVTLNNIQSADKEEENKTKLVCFAFYYCSFFTHFYFISNTPYEKLYKQTTTILMRQKLIFLS
jgi:hypothetical protein